MPAFTPSPSAVRINTLWFLSLIFSLATVLIGIIALQWLREHLRPQSDLEPQIAFSLHYLNVESLDRWYLPQIFTALPLLLQIGLVLFLAGTLDFLWSLNHSVAVPVAVAIGVILLFLLWTSISPTIQALFLLFPRWKWATRPRSPCPYRSPQSWAFYRLLRPLINILLNTFNRTNIEQPFTSRDYALVPQSMITEKDRLLSDAETTSRRQMRPTNLIFRHDIVDSWAKIGIAWLFQRDLDDMRLNQNLEFAESDLDKRLRPVPVFDTVKALIDIGANGSLRDIFLAQECVEPVIYVNKSDVNYMKYLSHLVDLKMALDNSQDSGMPLEVLKNHNALLFHCKIVGSESRQLEVAQRSVIELFANTTRTLMADGAKPLVDIWLLPSSPLSYFNFGRHPGEHN